MPLIIYYDIKSSVLLHNILVGRNNIRNGGVSLDLQINNSGYMFGTLGNYLGGFL